MVFVGPLNWDPTKGTEVSIWTKSDVLRVVVDSVHQPDFKNKIESVFFKNISDSANMSAPECHRQRTDFAEAIFSERRDDIGIMMNLTQIFVNPQRNLKGFADEIGALFAELIEEHKLPANIFGEIYASESESGKNIVVPIQPVVLVIET